jgi:hypothetical protein
LWRQESKPLVQEKRTGIYKGELREAEGDVRGINRRWDSGFEGKHMILRRRSGEVLK